MIQTDTLVGCVALAAFAHILLFFVRDAARHPPGLRFTTHAAGGVGRVRREERIRALREGVGPLDHEPIRGYNRPWNTILDWIVPSTTDGPTPIDKRILGPQDPTRAVPAPTAPWNMR
ncbi:hypothetical protein M407DRAFT_8249 [Tulasnella calospora MUT 4182]|uniref:Uncharacterized protein n=1 Tax=Tulasnella calospora MUT 4182 TaxID=1051891 RepID=A0A0C3LWA7_9AGAM|nr:hypothetical protein M407DRAFT_8249 [Tulasnella calospora MUT 4182]